MGLKVIAADEEIPSGEGFVEGEGGLSAERAALGNAILRASDPEKQDEIGSQVIQFLKETYGPDVQDSPQVTGDLLANCATALLRAARAITNALGLMHEAGLWM